MVRLNKAVTSAKGPLKVIVNLFENRLAFFHGLLESIPEIDIVSVRRIQIPYKTATSSRTGVLSKAPKRGHPLLLVADLSLILMPDSDNSQ